MKKLNGEAKKILFKDFAVREIAVLHAKTAVIFLLLATLAFWNVYLSSRVIQLRDEVNNLLIPTCEQSSYENVAPELPPTTPIINFDPLEK